MPVTSLDPPAQIILDNCVLSMLTDFCCESNRGLSTQQLLNATQNWLGEQLALLKSISNDGQLHTTQLVSAEYKPEGGKLRDRGLPINMISNIANNIRRQFDIMAIDNKVYSDLRKLPSIDPKLADPKLGVSDPDLSLFQLGLELTKNGRQVVLLTNDQDFLTFISWARTQLSLRKPPYNPLLLEGCHCLAYLELIHRTCRITSEQMSKIINYVIQDTYARSYISKDNIPLNPQKGMRIINLATMINDNLTQSMKIKASIQKVAI